MSSVCILTPIVTAAWPVFTAAVAAAATSMGYTVADHLTQGENSTRGPDGSRKVDLELPDSQIVTGTLARQQEIRVVKDDVCVVFSRDARGRASLCVTGVGRSDDELRALGTELSGRVVQQYVYQKLMDEMSARRFLVVGHETDENNAIRLKVRHWED